MTAFVALLNAIAAIPALAGYLEKLVVAISVWQIERATNENKQAIVDAASYAARAVGPVERASALTRWRDALSRNRVSN